MKLTAKIIVILLAVVLSLSVLPTLSLDIFTGASAAVDYTVHPYSGVDVINATLNGYAADPEVSVVNMTLTNNVDLTGTGQNAEGVLPEVFSSGITGIVIPEGLTVNLFLNGRQITYYRPENGAYKLPYVYGIHNKGTLNVYSGASPEALVNAGITLINIRTSQNCTEDQGTVYSNFEGIRNEGTLTVNRNVSITVQVHNEFDETNNDKQEQIANGATAIYNTKSTASCVVNGANLSATATSISVYNADTEYDWGDVTYYPSSPPCNSTAVAYGIYGGNVNISGGTSINVAATAKSTRESDTNDRKHCGESKITGISYGIATSGNVSITGASISHNATLNSSNATTSEKDVGSINLYSGGIYVTTGHTPVIVDATINAGNGSISESGDDRGARRYSEGTVVSGTEMPKSSDKIVSDNYGYQGSYQAWPNGTISVSKFLDEVGNSYDASIATTINTHPVSIVRGAKAGTNRVHIVYRYWLNANRKDIDTSIVGSDGNVGYSYKPLTDGTNVVKTLVSFNNVTASNNLTKANTASVSYNNGGEPKNSNYWRLSYITYTQPDSWFSDYNVAAPQTGTLLDDFSSADTHPGTPVSDKPIYIFVDYVRVTPISISAELKNGNIATTTYTGAPIKASDFGLKIVDSSYGTDFTNEYDIDCNNDSLINVEYSYEGTNAAGKTEKGSGMPTNAGTYKINLKIADQTNYGSDPAVYKNRLGVDYDFTLVIEKASVLRGNLPTSIPAFTYGETLGKALSLDLYNATGLVEADKDISGAFTFSNASDMSSFKDVGTHTVEIKWTPEFIEDAEVSNYKETVFEVEFTVNKAPLKITPNNAEVVYGDTEFKTPFSVTLEGVVADDSVSEISKAISYEYIDGNYSYSYNSERAAGIYYIKAVLDENSAVLANYNCEVVPNVGQLTIAKRPLTVLATAADRAYEANNNKVNVTFTVTAGLHGNDSVAIGTMQGMLDNNAVGTREVIDITLEAVNNQLSDVTRNYAVEKIVYATGEKLLVNIEKATLEMQAPVISDRYYQADVTLADISLPVVNTPVSGAWKWVDGAINPTVAVSSYKAQFIPDDKENYEIITADVTVNVKQTPVTITYNATISYGDNVPNITDYTYSSVEDPNFNIKNVLTSGNITPATDYKQMDPVGEYAVTVKADNFVDKNNNYIFAVQNGVIKVEPRKITFTVSDASVVYGENFTPSADNVNVTWDESSLVGNDTFDAVIAGDIAFTYTTGFSEIDNYQVGSYNINAVPGFTVSNNNYAIEVISGTLNVTKAPLTIKTNNITLEYNSDLPGIEECITLVGAKKEDTLGKIVSDGEIKIDTTYKKGSVVNRNGYPITIDISEAQFNNYEVSVESAVVTVIKANLNVTAIPSAKLTYGLTLADAIFEGGDVTGSVAGKFVYDNSAEIPVYREEEYKIYTATFIPEDTANYNTVKNIIVPLSVQATEVYGNLSVTGTPTVGNTLTVDASNLVPSELNHYTIIWYAGGAEISRGTELTLTDEHLGKTITVKAESKAPYRGNIESDSFVVATSDLASIEDILNNANIGNVTASYNAQAHAVEFSNTALGTATVKYNGSKEAPVAADTYTVTVDIAATATYEPVLNHKIGTLTIEKAKYNVVAEVLDKVYDGTTDATAKIVSETGAAGNDDVSFDVKSAVFFFESAEAGMNKAANYNSDSLKLTGEDASNYDLILTLANGGAADITKKTLEVKIIPVERDYQKNNKNIYLLFETVAETLIDGDENLVYVDESRVKATIDDDNAGTREVTVSDAVLIGEKATNYELKFINLEGLTVEIHKAAPGYSVPMVGSITYDNTRPLSAITLGDSHWSWDPAVADKVFGAGTHTYKAIYTPDDTDNFTTVEQNVTFTISKATVTVKAESFTVTYGDNEPTYRYTVSGVSDLDKFNDEVNGYVIMNSDYNAGKDIGEYDITIDSTLQSNNYNFEYESGKLTVAKRAVFVEAVAENRQFVPGNLNVTVNFSALENVYGSDNLSLSSLSVTGTVPSDAAGTKYVTFTYPTLIGDKASNYELVLLNPTVTVEITKADIGTVTFPTSATLTFGQMLGEIQFDASQNGTFAMADPETIPGSVGIFTDVYKVVFTPFNDNDYAEKTAFITITVVPAELPDMELYIEGTLQSGKTLYAEAINIPMNAQQYLNFKWYRVDSFDMDPSQGTLIAKDTDSYTLTTDDIGKFIICIAENTADAPYICSASCITDDTVEEEQLTFWQKIVNWFYMIIANITNLFGGLFG